MALKFYTDQSAPPPPRARSRCILCESEINPCPSHSGVARYEYGTQTGTYQAWRQEYPPSTWPLSLISATSTARPLETPITLGQLGYMLHERGLDHSGIETMLDAAFDVNALATSKEIERLVAEYDAGRVRNFGGLAHHVLKGISQGT